MFARSHNVTIGADVRIDPTPARRWLPALAMLGLAYLVGVSAPEQAAAAFVCSIAAVLAGGVTFTTHAFVLRPGRGAWKRPAWGWGPKERVDSDADGVRAVECATRASPERAEIYLRMASGKRVRLLTDSDVGRAESTARDIAARMGIDVSVGTAANGNPQ